MNNRCAACLIVSLVCAVSNVSGASFRFSTVDFPGATDSYVLGINNRGELVGGYQQNDAPIPVEGGFVLSGNQFTTFEVSGARGTVLFDINDAGQMLARFSDTSWNPHSLLIENGRAELVQVPGAYSASLATALNNSGLVVGYYDRLTGHHCPSGYSNPAVSRSGFLMQAGTFTNIDVPFDGAFCTSPADVNDNAAIVGSYETAGLRQIGFLLDSGVFTRIEIPNSLATLPVAINSTGDIAGQYFGVGFTGNFVIRSGELVAVDVPGYNNGILDMNDAGVIVGFFRSHDDNRYHGFVGTPVPEPASWVLVPGSLLLLCCTRISSRCASLRECVATGLVRIRTAGRRRIRRSQA
ncbi:MAG TPA: hypothetical protein VEX68_27790 [Bryobacteraceae bacterium]|nr:hypothetical protein [Bryobacteraceae bacterium]